MAQSTQNAQRFINAYNRLDSEIRVVLDLYERSTFSQAIRKASEKSPLVRRYQDDLLSFAKLRNAIVHDSIEGKIIAEPLSSVVEEFEKIVEAMLMPKTICQCNFGKSVKYLSGRESIGSTVVEILESGFSNLPVFDGKKILGVLSNKRVVEIVARAVKSGVSVDEILQSCKSCEGVFASDKGKYYEIQKEQTRIDEIVKLYEKNPNLALVVITKNGTQEEKITQVVAPSDITKLTNMLEAY